MAGRTVERVIESVATSDGAGVKLRRSVGSSQFLRHDPFLMLDEFYSDNPDDYIAGFPSHPHRGFETVTYMLDGHMRHEDSVGNRGDLGPGDVQWMSAARGIIHSEMPQQTEGRMRGFQLWINLPATEKMKDPGYRDIPSEQIPGISLDDGGEVRVIAGTLSQRSGDVKGAVTSLTTDPLYLDVRLPPNTSVELPIKPGYNAFVYLYDGDAVVGEDRQPLKRRTAGLLCDGSELRVETENSEARFLLLAGKPLSEPVAQYGPFVMNTREEIEQAVQDYQNGSLTLTAEQAQRLKVFPPS